MQYLLLLLKAPTNIEKKVRELKVCLYRDCGLISALALPVMIPLCFLPLNTLEKEPTQIRDTLVRAAGKQAPFLRSGSILESDGSLFWDLEPREQLQRLSRSCKQAFLGEGAQVQSLFPVARGFYLCSLEGRPRSSLPSLTVPEPLSFPARAFVLLHFHSLGGDPQAGTVSQPGFWWQSLFWEELQQIVLRKP